MVKLNRATEYGLIALKHIRNKEKGSLASAREIANEYNLPFEILAKTLQKLKEQGVITSTFGTRGGYQLSVDLSSLNLLDFLKIMEGNPSVVSCVDTINNAANENCCSYGDTCSIRPIMSKLNDRVYDFLRRISVDELTQDTAQQPNTIKDFSFNSAPIQFELSGGEP